MSTLPLRFSQKSMNSSASYSLSRMFSRKYCCFSSLWPYIRFNQQSADHPPSLPIIISMTELCQCHCGTRICLDEQLLEERQTWKEKYTCLQKQAANDIGRLKENIYAECAALMQKEFTARESEHNLALNEKNAELKSLTTRVINLEAKIKISEKENEILRSRARELEETLNDRDNLVQNLRSKGSKTEHEWESRLEHELTALRKRITEQYHEELQKSQVQNEHLKHKVREYQSKYQLLIPEVEKMKSSILAKNQQIQLLSGKLEKSKKDGEAQLQRVKQELEQAQKVHSKCRGTIGKLSEKVQALTHELQAAKRVKREVKVEPVYIQRPVEVEKVVEKIIEVEKIVNKYIEPTAFRDEELQREVAKLKGENAQLLGDYHQLQEKYLLVVKDYQESLRQYEDNETRYKKEREELVKRLVDQEREIDSIHTFLEKRKNEAASRSGDPEKITIHVSKDGKYQKTVDKVSGKGVVYDPPSVKISKKR